VVTLGLVLQWSDAVAMYIENPEIEEDLKARRQAWGVDGRDEVWEGVYFMPPMANDDHQDWVFEFSMVLGESISKRRLGKVRPGINLAASAEDWEYDYRVPDVVVFLATTAAKNHGAFWTGAADFIIEITSPRDRTYEKIPFYSRLGVRELLILNRQKWALELYRHNGIELQMIAESTLEKPDVLSSQMLPLSFRLIPGDARPNVEVVHNTSGERWVV
jgi:Uma2 family endonuclease